MDEETLIPLNWLSQLSFFGIVAFILAFFLFSLGSLILGKPIAKSFSFLLAIFCGGLFSGLSIFLPPGEIPNEVAAFGAGLGGLIGAYTGCRSGFFLALGPDSFAFSFARRISFKTTRSVSGLLVILGILSIMLGIGVMEISISILFGFKKEIQNKVVGFGSHIQITDFENEYNARFTKISGDQNFIPEIKQRDDVASVYPFVYLPGMLQNHQNLEGILMKGVPADFDWSFFNQNLREGSLPDYHTENESKEILISEKQSKLLNLKTGDHVYYYYFEEKPRVRKLKIQGLYETGLEEFDASAVMCDIRLLQRIAGFSENEVMGFDVNLKDVETLERTAIEIEEGIPSQFRAVPINEKFPEIFDWLEVQHQNVWAIIFLMVMIAIINMITVSLISILERTRTIGILKALGLSNRKVIRIFAGNTFILILAGTAAGNFFGLGMIALQQSTGLIQVNQESYFVKIVPVAWPWDYFLLINAGVIIICMIFTLLPTLVINRIKPIHALRFD